MPTDRSYLFTSESVSKGHPDKLADRISATVLDAYLEGDPTAVVTCEAILDEGLVVLAGEFRTPLPSLCGLIWKEAPNLVLQEWRDTGDYNTFPCSDIDNCEVVVRFNLQAPNISKGVKWDVQLGAGAQGMVFGYVCDETPKLLPLPQLLAHRLIERQAEVGKNGKLPWLRPDAKSQATVCYLGAQPLSIEMVVFSTHQTAEIDTDALRAQALAQIFLPILPKNLHRGMQSLINSTGRSTIYGPKGNTGLTDRKIIVNTFSRCRAHGGGAFSDKHPSALDRSVAYTARYVAKNIVDADLAKRCMVQIAHPIGKADPVSLFVNTHQTGRFRDEILEQAVRQVFNLTPSGINRAMGLCRPISAQTLTYGPLGRDSLPRVPDDRVEALLQTVSAQQGGRHA